MFKLFKTRTLGHFAVLLLAGFLLATCDMGLGPSIDLEPPTITVTTIIRPDGTEESIEEGNKLFVGPGIRVGAGFTLKGTAQDNVNVELIIVEETGSNAKLIDGKPPTWSDAAISSPARMGGIQEWSITLDGIEKGERMISITAYDKPKNIGPDTVKQLTLLVDTDPPFIESIKIERKPGLQVDLLPKAILESFDPYLFGNIDFFQNEEFRIRAAIDHDYSLSNVWLNFIDDAGNEVFPAPGLERTEGSEFAPVWLITAKDLIDAKPAYATGRHYLNVLISAKATAGHSGSNDLSNLMFNLCWYPEVDTPRINKEDAPETGQITVETGGVVLVNVFDDDDVGEVYATMVPVQFWNDFRAGSTDEQKLQWLITGNNRNDFSDGKDGFPLTTNKLNSPSRNTTIAVPSGDTGGEYRMIILVRDKKDNASLQKWEYRLVNVLVIELGAPTITIISPDEDRPQLNNGEFILSGTVLDIYPAELLRVLWIPSGLGMNAEDRQSTAEELLKSNQTGTLANGIKIWDVPLGEAEELTLESGKLLQRRGFSWPFNILTDFTYGGKIENAEKFLMLYTRSLEAFEFETLMLMPYEDPPEVSVTQPTYMQEFTPNAQIPFTISIKLPFGVPIKEIGLTEKSTGREINLTRIAPGVNVWTGIDLQGHEVMQQYDYLVTVKDELDNPAEGGVSIRVTAPPTLDGITSPHPSGTWFSTGEKITIRANFSHNVSTVTETPRIALTVGTNTRYADYTGGVGGKALEFVYTVVAGDYAPSGIIATQLQTQSGSIGAQGLEGSNIIYLLNEIPNLAGKTLYVDGVAPTITGVTFATKDGDESYPDWIRAGAIAEASVKVNKPIRVSGTPQLTLMFDGTTTRAANFLRVDGVDTMVFEYKIQNGDQAEPIRYNLSTCFTNAQLLLITDTIGATGNVLALSALPGTAQNSNPRIQVDAIPPSKLVINSVSVVGDTETFRVSAVTGGTLELSPTVKQYTLDGITWPSGTMTDPNYEFTISDPKIYKMQARQIDRAGNIGPHSDIVERDLASKSDLISVICDNPNGAYALNQVLTFRLGFSGPIFLQGGTPSITLAGGTGTANGTITPTLQNTASITQANPTDVLTFTWTTTANRIMDPVRITAISLTGIKNADNPNYVVKNSVTPESGDSLKRPSLKVLTQAPTIIAGLPLNTPTDGSPVTGATTNILAPTTTVTPNQSQLSLTFSHAVWPEKGYIIVRPADGWHIPPVLSNDDYSRVLDALSTADQNTLNNYYTQTTHGLAKNTSGQYTGTPDTSTKYVLRFDVGVSGTAAPVSDLRAIFERAKYLWQEIEVVSASQITTGAGNAIPSATGTATIRVNMNKLADGRLWRVGIEGGAFRDEAGNVFAGWQWGTTDWNWTNTTTNRFWSQKVAEPVIRVNRVSNNHTGLPRATGLTPQDNVQTGTVRETDERTLRINVRYRIDSETPGATIQYRSSYDTTVSKTSTVIDTTNATGYGGNSEDGIQNSTLTDATATELNGTGMNPNVAYTLTGTNYLTMGDTNLYTARKDYITASATRTNLSNSDRGAEGAFKTVIVYRRPPVNTAKPYMKTEAVDQRNGAVSIAGFPMDYNDMSGRSSKYAYQVPDGQRQVAGTDDWVWISWEMVSTFYHVGMTMIRNAPNSAFTEAEDSWEAFSGDWYNHNFRKYGNWGLRIGE